MKRSIEYAPELLLLEGNVKGTPEGEKSAGMESKRTRLSLKLIKWVLEGNYTAFTACQNDDVRLSPISFAQMQQYTRRMIKSDDDLYAMMAYLVINDLGKVVPFIDQIKKELNLQSVDHDELLYEGLKQRPKLSETFSSLEPKYQELILNGLKTKFNMGQMVQSENLPVHLIPLADADYNSIYFYMIHVLYDIGGAAGHVRDDGSIIITEAYWKNFKAASDEIFSMIAGNVAPIEAYNNYLIFRAKMLELEFSDSASDIAVIKICNMLRINSVAEAKIVKDAYESQLIQTRELLNKEFSKTGVNDAGILLYYSPATLSNAVAHFKKAGSENPIKLALDIVLPVFATILAQTRAQMAKDGNHNTCTAFIADIAEKAKTPNELQDYIFELTKVNSDYSVTAKKKENITLDKTENIEILGKNILTIALGGGSDCIQAAMVAKFLLPSKCQNIISIRTQKTCSQNEYGEMNNERVVSNPKEIIAEGVYLCDSNTSSEGRFFEHLPTEIGFNVYLVIDKHDGNLATQIQEVINHIYQKTGEKIDTILGVDTGGDCLYPENFENSNQDTLSLMAISEFTKNNANVYNCIVAPGIDSPNGITSEILKNANAKAYFPSEAEAKNILNQYDNWKIDGSNPKRFGKTPLVWQAALKKRRGLVVLNIPLNNVLSTENPWIPNHRIDEIMESVVFMKTSDCINAIKMYNK